MNIKKTLSLNLRAYRYDYVTLLSEGTTYLGRLVNHKSELGRQNKRRGFSSKFNKLI